MLRVSRRLHGQLVAAAKRSGISLNKFAAELMASGLGERSAVESLRSEVQEALAELRKQNVAQESRPPLADSFPNAIWNTTIHSNEEDGMTDAIRRYQQGKAA